jgi:hypothetical protein
MLVIGNVTAAHAVRHQRFHTLTQVQENRVEPCMLASISSRRGSQAPRPAGC